jgi:hypothetical protein
VVGRLAAVSHRSEPPDTRRLSETWNLHVIPSPPLDRPGDPNLSAAPLGTSEARGLLARSFQVAINRLKARAFTFRSLDPQARSSRTRCEQIVKVGDVVISDPSGLRNACIGNKDV